MISIIVLIISKIFKYYYFIISFFFKISTGKNFPSDFCRFAQTFLGLTAPTPNRYPATVTAKNGEFKISWKSINSNRKTQEKTKACDQKSQACTNWLLHMDCLRPLHAKAHSTTLIRFAPRPADAGLSLVAEPLFSWFKSKSHNIKHKKTPIEGCFFMLGCPTWIRTTINAVRVRCPAVRRWGNHQKLGQFYCIFIQMSTTFFYN